MGSALFPAKSGMVQFIPSPLISYVQNIDLMIPNNDDDDDDAEIPLRGVSNSWSQKPWEGVLEQFISVRRSQRSNYNLICTVGCVLLFITHASFLTLLWMLNHSSDGFPILLTYLAWPPSFKIAWMVAFRQISTPWTRFWLALKFPLQKSVPRFSASIPELRELK